MRARLRVSIALVAVLSCIGALVVGMSTPAAAVAADQFAWPATGHTDAGDVAWHQTYENGSRAVDIQAPLGTEVGAAQPGVVTVAFNGCANSNSWDCGNGFGNHVVVRHDRAGVSNPLYTLYAHLNSSLNVGVGTSVNLGQTLGVIAMSGSTEGPHAHFAISVCATVWWGDSCTIWRGPDTASTTVYKGGAVPGSYPELAGSSSTPSRLSAVQYNNELSVFKRGGDKAIWKNTWQPANNAWSGWSSMEGVLAGDPTAIVYGGGLHVFAVADNGQLVQKYWNGSAWSGWVSLGGNNLAGRPAVVQYGDELAVFVRNGSNNELYKKSYFPTSGWGVLSSMGSGINVASNPSAVQYYGELTVVARGGNNDILKWTWNGSSWGSGSMGGITSGDPVVMKYNSELQIWATDYLGQPAKRVWNGTSWSDWNNLGGTMGGSPAVMQYGSELNVYARNKNNSIVYKNTWQPSLNNWSGWVSLGGNIASDPTAMQYNNEMIVWGTNYANTTDKNTWNGMQWSGFTALP